MSAEEDSTVEAPSETPSMPSPAEAEERPEREPKAERNARAAESNSPPRIEPRPHAYGISVHIRRVVSGHIYHIRVSRLDVDIRPILVHPFLRRSPQIARVISLVTHGLDRLH